MESLGNDDWKTELYLLLRVEASQGEVESLVNKHPATAKTKLRPHIKHIEPACQVTILSRTTT